MLGEGTGRPRVPEGGMDRSGEARRGADAGVLLVAGGLT